VNSLEESPWFSEADTLCASVSENYIRNKSINKDEAHHHPNIFPSTTLTSIPFFFKRAPEEGLFTCIYPTEL
jgi:hypothetical protein